MEVSIRSRTNKDISYCFSDRSPEGPLKDILHLADNFSYDPSKFNQDSDKRFREAINDCAHPELQALMEEGLEAVTRFIKAFGIKAQPLYVYRINIRFYEQKTAA